MQLTKQPSSGGPPLPQALWRTFKDYSTKSGLIWARLARFGKFLPLWVLCSVSVLGLGGSCWEREGHYRDRGHYWLRHYYWRRGHFHWHRHCHGQKEENDHQSGVISMVDPIRLIGSLFICPQLEIFLRLLWQVWLFRRWLLYSPLGHSKETDSMAAATWKDKINSAINLNWVETFKFKIKF